MPLQPSRSDLHVNRPLTVISVANIQDEKAFIADKVFPIVPVQKQSDRYFVYLPDFWFKTGAAKRAPASESVGTGYRVDNTPSYFADTWAVHHDIPDEDRSNADDPLLPDEDATAFVTRQLLLRREKQFVSQFMTTGVWQGYQSSPGVTADFAPNVNGAGYWDSSTSNPLLDIDNIRAQVEQQTGYMPNTLVVTRNAYYALRNHPVVLDRIKYTQRGLVTEDLLASLFGVDKFLISAAVINTAQEGQVMANSFLASNSFLLTYAPPAPGLRTPSGGYIFSWVGRFGAGAFGNRIKKYRMEHLDADRIEGEMAFAMQPVSKGMGVYGFNVLLRP
jgi:hypothetical protein